MVLTYIVFVSLILSAVSITTVILLYKYINRVVSSLIDEFGMALIARKRYRRVKRYILAKVICGEDVDVERMNKDIERSINSLLGSITRMDCNITLISLRPDLNRAIFRVIGNSICIKYSLLALSLQHLTTGNCIIVPLRTSGLLSRIRKFTGYRK